MPPQYDPPMRKLLLLLLPLVPLPALVACSTEMVYLSAQQWQKNECGRLPDHEERTRCEKNASLSYERYQAEAAKSRP
jgi:hypothetical protein